MIWTGRRRSRRVAGPVFVAILLVTAGLAAIPRTAGAAPFYAPPSANPAVPTPESVLGYELGAAFTPYHRVVDYLEAVATASPRVELERYGESYEGRPLLLLRISSPENLARQEDIRRTYLALAEERGLSDGEVRGRTRELPLGVWYSFNIHGNEASSSEAAMALVYWLAASNDGEVASLLDEVVLLLDPCLNPDGRDRYVHWYGGTAGSRPDPWPAGREHHEPFPGGRYNHYLFDLNRDWAWLTQTESRARAAAYLRWRPQVHVDFHEMYANESYFFFPPEKPVHALYPPQVMKWAEIFGRGNAAAFDARGWRYYTAESFDLYYPGYGDSWPTFQGAIGMTYEQAGHGFAGAAIRVDDRTTLTLRDRVEHHLTAAQATLRTAADNREARLMDFHRFFAADPALSSESYLIHPGVDPPRAAQLVSLLMAHGAEVYRTREAAPGRAVEDYDGRSVSVDFPEGTYVVPMDQPLHRFLRALLEPEAMLPDTLFYDVSAWSLPLAFGVDAYVGNGRIAARTERLGAPPVTAGSVIRPDARYAFLISWERNGAPRAASMLLARDVRVHYSTREFLLNDRKFSPGSLVVFRAGNPDSLPAILAEVARTSGVEVIGTDTGLTAAGPDLGSGSVRAMKRARVALVADEPVSPTSAGACWYLLDRLYDIPHSLIRPDALRRDALEHYDVVVLPDDWRGGHGYAGAMDSTMIAELSSWIEEGGVLVGLGGGAFFATQERSGLSSVTIVPPPEEDNEFSDEEREERDRLRRLETRAEREARERTEALPGTIFRVRVDPLHPLGFGYTGEARVLKISSRALELGPPGSNVAVFTTTPKVSGYAPAGMIERFRERPFLIDEPRGRGHVVLYVEDPNFRLFWYGLTRLFLNSIFFLPQDR